MLLLSTASIQPSGRYLFLNAIANQLRYPNSHTHYFSCALLSLFAETNVEAIQEQITRWVMIWSDTAVVEQIKCIIAVCCWNG